MAEKPKNKKTDPLASFKSEMASIARMEKEGKLRTAYFAGSGFDVNELTDADKMIWDKIKNESITKEDWRTYRNKVVLDPKQPGHISLRGNTSSSRRTFIHYASNKVTVIFGKRELKQEKNQTRK